MIKQGFSAALARLDSAAADYSDVVEHGSLRVGLYRPCKVDHQTPHRQDEIYVVQTGRGEYFCDGRHETFEPGDMLFAPAFAEHRFDNFSDDLTVWVIFYGPDGGEQQADDVA